MCTSESAGRPRDAVFKCLSDPMGPLSVWIVPITAARYANISWDDKKVEAKYLGDISKLERLHRLRVRVRWN